MKNKILNSQFSVLNFKFSLKEFVIHPLFSGSVIMIIGSNFSNFIAYIYHLIIGRMLGPSSYGELAAMISLMGLIFISFNFFGLVIVKFVSAAQESELNSILNWFKKRVFIIGGILSFILLLLVPYLSDFLKVNIKIVWLIVPIFITGVLSFLYSSFLQGMMKFKEVVIPNSLNMLTRLFLGVFFIYLGLSVFGVVVGIFLAGIIAVLLLGYYLKDIKIKKGNYLFTDRNKVLKYSIPILVYSFATTSFFTSDVILVKHFFNPHDAGIYASLSTLGKIIFYGTAPISAVMFPMVSKKHSRGESHKRIFFLSFLLTLAISLAVVLIYWILPGIAVNILFGSKFLEATRYLVWFGIFMTIYTLSSLLANYYLSQSKTKITTILVIFAFLQIIGIWFFHANIFEVIKISIFAVSLLLISLFIYFAYEGRKTI